MNRQRAKNRATKAGGRGQQEPQQNVNSVILLQSGVCTSEGAAVDQVATVDERTPSEQADQAEAARRALHPQRRRRDEKAS